MAVSIWFGVGKGGPMGTTERFFLFPKTTTLQDRHAGALEIKAVRVLAKTRTASRAQRSKNIEPKCWDNVEMFPWCPTNTDFL